MGRGNKKRRAPKDSATHAVVKNSYLKSPILLTSLTVLVALIVTISFAASGKKNTATESKPDKSYSLEYLVKLSDEELAKYDIAELNLACAEGLPGAENINIPQSLKQLDEWAKWIRSETDRHLYHLTQNPADYENSEAYFRMLMLITVAMQDFGVKYNPDRIYQPDFTHPEDLFIHGLLNNHGGTCVSMPVLYTALGRRLGYPLRLSQTIGHVFVRWDDPHGERLNIEGTNKDGMSSHPDEYYKSWPHKWSSRDERAGCFLKSLSHRQELALFLMTRGDCLIDIGRKDESLQAYRWAVELWPENPFAKVSLYMAERDMTHITDTELDALVSNP